MKYLFAVIFLISLMLFSGLAGVVNASGSVDGTANAYDTFNTTSNGISDFSVQVNGQTIEVFSYFNISGSSLSMDMPFVSDDKMMPLFWQGTGTVTIVPALSYSRIGAFDYAFSQMEYVYFYQTNYLGMLVTNGQISESGNLIVINSSANMGEQSISYINCPLSDYNYTENSFQSSGNSYYGNYSSFYYSAGQISNYSLINRQSAVSVISKISSSGSTSLSFNTQSLATKGNVGMFVSDGLFPLIYLDGFNTSMSIKLAEGFHFGYREDFQSGNGGSGEDPSSYWPISMGEEHIFKIQNGFRILGYVDVYGGASLNNSTLVVNSPISFVVVRFLPSVQTTGGPSQSNNVLGNASTEIFIDNQAYFIPFSPNVTYQNLSFDHGNLLFQFTQNGTQKIVVVIQGNFTVSKFSLNGVVEQPTNYTVTRTANETIISFGTSGNGTQSLSLSIVPYQRGTSQIPLMALVISLTALVAVTISLIVLSRKNWVKRLEKG